MKSSYIYFMVDDHNKRVKIGKSNDPFTRYQTLSKVWYINLNKSFMIKTLSSVTALNLEAHFHYTFKNRKINIDKKHDGYTEWFDISCLEDVDKILNIMNYNYVHENIEKKEKNQHIIYENIKININKPIIYKSKDLMLSIDNFSLIQKKILYYIISRLPQKLFMDIKIIDLCQFLNNNFNSNNNFGIYNSFKDMTLKNITLKNGDTFKPIKNFEHEKNSRFITIFLSPTFLKNIQQFDYQYNYYDFQKVYSFKFFDFLKSYKKFSKYKQISVKNLKEFLNIKQNQYKLFAHFKNKIIKPCINEINDFTQSKISFEIIRESRKPVSIIFKGSLKF